jgi:DNA-binding MarR family transcriptional regulator
MEMPAVSDERETPVISDRHQLGQLSEEVQRLAARVAHLSIGATGSPVAYASGVNAPAPSLKLVEDVILLRRLRSEQFGGNLFSDPPWDILLALLHSELSFGRLSISELANATGIAQSTVMRWLATLAEQRLIVRRPDHFDGRRVYIELTPASREPLYNHFAEMVATLGIGAER